MSEAPTVRGEELDASVVWQRLSEQLDALVAAWDSEPDPPALTRFLPDGPPPLRRLTLVEAIKVDLENRIGRGLRKTIEDYLAEFPELVADGKVPCDIIYEEFHVRRQHDEPVSVEEYCQRFPDRADEIKRLLRMDSAGETSRLVARERMPKFEAGQRVDDFELIKPLGKGAFASVFLARQVSLGRMVAVKISSDKGFEPQTLAQLEHPHIVRVFDQRQLPQGKLRLLYMQYVAGGTLQDVVAHVRSVPPAARSGATLLQAIDAALVKHGDQPPADSLTRFRLSRMSWPEAVCWLGARLASALAYAHERGVLHRDVKPANVLVGGDGQPHLADFNISFSKVDGATPAAYFGGSLAYMSPEQLEAFDPAHSRQPDELDAKSDVYSLGLLLWELLVGRRPFSEEALSREWSQALGEMTALRRAGVTSDARSVAITCGGSIVTATLGRCLHPDPIDRYTTAGELARELELCLQPRAHALLRGSLGVSAFLRRHPVPSTIILGLVPNIVLCIVNIVYNWNELVRNLSSDEARIFIQFQLMIVNTVAYAIGLGYIFYTRGRLFLTLTRLSRGDKLPAPPDPVLGSRCLTFGAAAAVVTACLWAVSGFVFPAWMQYGAGAASQMASDVYRHFVVSNLLCGLIAATQTYYVVTFLSLRYCYPWLVSAGGTNAESASGLVDLARLGRIVLGLAVVIPFLALGVLVLINFKQGVVGGLGVLGLAGVALAYLLDLAIRGDIAALASTVSPLADSLSGTDSIDSYLAGTKR